MSNATMHTLRQALAGCQLSDHMAFFGRKVDNTPRYKTTEATAALQCILRVAWHGLAPPSATVTLSHMSLASHPDRPRTLARLDSSYKITSLEVTDGFCP